MRNLFVIVSGAPGSGKSTLARQLAPALDLPLIMKDTIKEALGDEFPVQSADESKRLGLATLNVMYALMRDNPGGVFESTWIPELARDELGQFTPLVEVLCDAPVDVAMQRFAERSSTRHGVHGERFRPLNRDEFAERARPVDGGWPVVRVDTSAPYDIDDIVRRVATAI
jgi:glucokinase